jgi:hypothetical protein
MDVQACHRGGRVVFVDYKAEDPRIPTKQLHKMSEAQIKHKAAVFTHPLWLLGCLT